MFISAKIRGSTVHNPLAVRVFIRACFGVVCCLFRLDRHAPKPIRSQQPLEHEPQPTDAIRIVGDVISLQCQDVGGHAQKSSPGGRPPHTENLAVWSPLTLFETFFESEYV